MSSGVASRCALYCGNASSRKVLPWSNATPMRVGRSFCNISLRVLTNPMTAEVFMPLELMRGFLMNA